MKDLNKIIIDNLIVALRARLDHHSPSFTLNRNEMIALWAYLFARQS